MPSEDAILKNKTLQALTRLGDRDTQRVAVKELERLATNAREPDHVTTIVSCLCEELVAAPKASARREILRLFDRVCALQGKSALVHLPRMVSSVCRRFKDPDSNVSDACVDTMGSLAEFTCRLPPRIDKTVATGPDSIGANFLRPILDVLHETNSKQAQDTACRSMARVIRRCGPGRGNADAPAGNNWYPDGGAGKLAARLARASELPNFHAKPALLHALTALFAAAGGQCGAHLPAVLGVSPSTGGDDDFERSPAKFGGGGVLAALRSDEWPTRRAAAEALSALLYALGPLLDNSHVTLTPLGTAIERALEDGRHDKVKPARDAIASALALARELRNFREKGPGGDDVSAWRNWAREELGEGIADVGEHVGGGAGARAGLKPGITSPRRPRGHGAGTARRELSEAFMEAHARRELPGDGDVVEVAVPKNPPPPHVVQNPGRLAEEADPAEGASATSTRGGWEVSDGGAATGPTGDDDKNGDENVEPRQGTRQGQGQGSNQGRGAGGGLPPRAPSLPPSKRPPVAARETLRAIDDARAFEDDDDDDAWDAPRWMTLAEEIGRGGGGVGVVHVEGLKGNGTNQTYTNASVVVAATNGDDDDDDASAAANVSRVPERATEKEEVAELRRQMTSLAQAHATVLERLGVFVQESSAAIANLTSRVEGAERAVVDAVERVELMENQVGAAVSAGATVAASAAALAAAHPDTARLAEERAALEREKAQLRDAAAQLERAASNLERVVPPPRR